jgi:alpha-beta hydrolase superfamily lysophospholipase
MLPCAGVRDDGGVDLGQLPFTEHANSAPQNYDQRGHGRSLGTLSPRDGTMERFVADLEAVCDAVSEGAVTLLGHSGGKHLALRFALRHNPGSVA